MQTAHLVGPRASARSSHHENHEGPSPRRRALKLFQNWGLRRVGVLGSIFFAAFVGVAELADALA